MILKILMVIYCIVIVVNCIFILFMYLNPIIKKFIYPKDSVKHFEDIINEFDKNIKAIDHLDTSAYKLGSGHIYQ